MGLETICRVKLNSEISEGKAHCGDGELDFRGEFRLRWKWSELERVSSNDGILTAVRGSDLAEFYLGEDAVKWEHAIKNPRSRLDKLGLKPHHIYTLWGDFDEDFSIETTNRAGEPSSQGPYDLVFVRLWTTDDLVSLNLARESIASNGGVWAVWLKGKKELSETHIRDFALANGLVDVKVASFSETLSSLKVVIPVALR
ncbi:MAG: hypothetical protein WCG75_01775 [Armatimonadota bacterium]